MKSPFHEEIANINKEFTRTKRLDSIMVQTSESTLKTVLTITKGRKNIALEITSIKNETPEEFVKRYEYFLKYAEKRLNNEIKTAQYTRPKGMYIFQALARLFNRAMSK